MTSLARSLAETEVLRSLQATEDLWLRTNRKLVDGEQDELPKPFFTRAEMDAVLERHAEEIAALKPADPTPGSWADWKRKQADEKARAPAASSPYSLFAAALSKARGEAPNVELSAAGSDRHGRRRLGGSALQDGGHAARGAEARAHALPASADRRHPAAPYHELARHGRDELDGGAGESGRCRAFYAA